MPALVERIVHFEPGDFLVSGCSHFGFRAGADRLYAISHPRHFLGLVERGELLWTLASRPVFPKTPNIAAELEFPMYADTLADGAIVVSNLGNARLYRVDPGRMTAEVLVEGHDLGIVDMGNCVVDPDGFVWVNEVTGCRIWRFDPEGRPVLTLGDGTAGFTTETVELERAKFSWVYDLRRGPGGSIWILDSGNFAVRAVDLDAACVRTVAGSGMTGYSGDGGDACAATFGSDPTARFNGPISLALDERGNAYVGDRFNHVVRRIDAATGLISTIAGRRDADDARPNDPAERDPLRLNLPQISSMDYADGRLFVPTDLDGDAGDLAVLQVRP